MRRPEQRHREPVRRYLVAKVCITYTPAPNYNGLDSICVIVCDNLGACDTSTTVIHGGSRERPAGCQSRQRDHAGGYPRGDQRTGQRHGPGRQHRPHDGCGGYAPTNGTTSVDPVTGAVTYTPNPNYNGPDVFTYAICDTGLPVLCDTAVVTINVTPVNDPPVFDLPNDTTNEDTPVTVCTPISDPDRGQRIHGDPMRRPDTTVP